MVIQTSPPPPEAIEAIREGLGPRASKLRSRAEGLEVGAPLPRYRITARQALGPRPLPGARLAAWDYPLFGPARPSLVALRCRERSLKFGGVVQGELPARVLNAAEMAERAFGEADSPYRVRLLDCPELKLLLLLCQPARGRTAFIAIMEGHLLPAKELRLRRGLGPYLRERANAELHSPPSRSDPSSVSAAGEERPRAKPEGTSLRRGR